MLCAWRGWLLLSLILFAATAAQAASSPEIQKGLAWLQSQVQADGSLAGESASLATPTQGRTETLTSLKLLATLPTPLVDAILANTADNTEYLARRIISSNLAGQNADADVTTLLARQNADGGFSCDSGFDSNPLDTAWALLALKALNVSAPVSGALNYLQSAQSIDGSFRIADRSDIYTSALALQALAAYSSQYALNANIQAAVSYLQAQQSATGGWADSPFLSAETYLALHDFIPQSPTASTLSSFLVSKQIADGSWDGDPYATALALRALILTGSAPANPSLSILRGKVVDAQTGLPLSGVAATLTGGAGVNLLTQADGVFEFRDLPPGDYALQLTLANYGAINAATATRSGQTQDMGVLRMSKSASATTGTVEGKITDAATGQPLAGATVTVNGAIGVTTDTAGLYQISNISPGAITLEASIAGYAAASSSGSLGAGGVLVFSPALAASGAPATTATLQGVVTSATTGQPLAGVIIAVSGANALSATTDAQGKFSLNGLLPGAITVTAALNGYDSVTAAATVFTRNTITFSPRMYLNATTQPGANTAGVTGVVLDAGSNAPLANVSIAATYGGVAKTIQSGADGRFSLAGIATAGVDLKFTFAGYQSSTVTVALDPLSLLDIGQVRLRNDKATTLLPDLTVKAVSRQNAVTDPQTLAVSGSVNATLANIGAVGVPAGVKVLAFQDTNRNGKYDPGIDQALGSAMLADTLAVMQTTIIQIPVQGVLPFRDAPIHVWADSDQTLVEIGKANNIKSTADSSEIKPNPALFQPKLKWAWSGSNILPTFTDVMSTPMALPMQDTNGDGKMDQHDIPGVVFNTFAGVTFSNGVLRAVNGKDGSELWTVSDPALRTAPHSSVAGADLDGDGKMDIVAVKDGGGLMAFDHTGKLKWISVDRSVGTGWYWGGPSIADLDHDGKPEIIIGNAVLNADGTTRWKGNGYTGTNYFSALSAVADINLDGNPVVLAGAQAYRGSDGATLWQNAAVGDGLVAVGNFNADPYPEIVVVGGGRISMLDHTGKIIWGPVTIPGGGSAGAPTVADMDGDGIPEIGVAGASRYTVFRADGSILWGNPVQDYSSAVTASSVFDFDGDGAAEVVYADETRLRVYRGADGSALFETPNSSGTTFEEPVIADVDGDGHADILICANQWTFAPGPNVFHGLRLFSDVNNAWVGTRRIWNQHTYHITNINDDGSVPQVEQNSWQVHNTYRLNARPGVSSTAAPDLSASYIRIQDRGGVQPSTFTVRIGNGGALAPDPGIFVAFYNGKPEAGGTLLGAAKTTLGLGSGEYQDIDFSYPGALTGIAELVIVADDDGSGKNVIADFDRTNNRASLLLSALPGSFAIQVATDQAGYGPNSAVAISATVTNTGSRDGNAAVRFLVETADGSINVATLPTTPLAVAKTGSGTVAAAWNTGTTYLGDYRIKAELLDGQGVPFAVATVAFGIGANATPAVAAKITTDKPSYLPTDIVNIAVRVSNLTQNRMLDGLTATTTIYQPGGGVLWSQTAPLAQLPPTAFKDSNYGVNLAMAAAGVYRAALAVQDSAGTTLAQTETTFTVQSTGDSGSGLKGSLSLSGKQVLPGDTLLINNSITNLGNSDVAGLPVTLSIIDPSNRNVLANWTYTLDIAKGQTYQGRQSWSVGAATVNATYVAVQSTTIGGKVVALAQDSFQLTVPLIKLEVKQEIERQGRLLALLTCGSEEDDSHRNGKSTSNDSKGDKDCLAPRTQFVEALLTTLNIPHLVTDSLDDFKRAFRSGQYNEYWISGSAGKLNDGNLAAEIREAVYRGDSLLQDGIHDERNKELDDVSGIVYRGKLAPDNQSLTLNGPIAGSTQLATVGRPIRFDLASGALLAGFGNAQREDNGNKSSNNKPGSLYPAIVTNTYGAGRSLTFAFDLIGTLQTQNNAPVWAELVRDQLAKLTPDLPDAYSEGNYVPVLTTLRNLSNQVDLKATTNVPNGATIIATQPITPPGAAGQVDWQFTLPVDAERKLSLAMRAPLVAGEYEIKTTIDNLLNGQPNRYGSYPLKLTVTATEALSGKLIADLQALVLSSKNQARQSKAVKSVQDALKKTAQAKYEEAIDALLNAEVQIEGMDGIDVSAQRHTIDQLLLATGIKWWQAALDADRVFVWAEKKHGLKPAGQKCIEATLEKNKYQSRCYVTPAICIGIDFANQKIKIMQKTDSAISDLNDNPLDLLNQAKKAGY